MQVPILSMNESSSHGGEHCATITPMSRLRIRLWQAKGPFEPTLWRRFPIGKQYRSLVTDEKENGRPWVEYKLHTAAWYLDTLDELYGRTGDFTRLIGEEMALDGYLTAGCAAFDAAVGGLCVAIEMNRELSTEQRTPPHLWTWGKAKQLTCHEPVIILGCQSDVDAALAGAGTDAPTGWLAQFQRLRNRAIHQDTLTRAFYQDMGGTAPSPPSRIEIPGKGAADPMPYLHGILPRLRVICELILTDSERLNPSVRVAPEHPE
jgi:hypothetical protein